MVRVDTEHLFWVHGAVTAQSIREKIYQHSGNYGEAHSSDHTLEWYDTQIRVRQQAEARMKKEREERERLEKENYTRDVLRNQAFKESQDRAKRDKQFEAEIEKKLRTYHEVPGEDGEPGKEWWPVYKELSPFLAKCVIIYRYGNDKIKGRTEGDLGECWGRNLAEYLSKRGYLADGDNTAAFETLVTLQVCQNRHPGI